MTHWFDAHLGNEVGQLDSYAKIEPEFSAGISIENFYNTGGTFSPFQCF
jgi:hypothetical protein